MINPEELRQSFATEGLARVRRNLSTGVYSVDVAESARRWLDDQDNQTASRLEEMLIVQQGLCRRALAAASVAAAGSICTLTLTLVFLVRWH